MGHHEDGGPQRLVLSNVLVEGSEPVDDPQRILELESLGGGQEKEDCSTGQLVDSWCQTEPIFSLHPHCHHGFPHQFQPHHLHQVQPSHEPDPDMAHADGLERDRSASQDLLASSRCPHSDRTPPLPPRVAQRPQQLNVCQHTVQGLILPTEHHPSSSPKLTCKGQRHANDGSSNSSMCQIRGQPAGGNSLASHQDSAISTLSYSSARQAATNSFSGSSGYQTAGNSLSCASTQPLAPSGSSLSCSTSVQQLAQAANGLTCATLQPQRQLSPIPNSFSCASIQQLASAVSSLSCSSTQQLLSAGACQVSQYHKLLNGFHPIACRHRSTPQLLQSLTGGCCCCCHTCPWGAAGEGALGHPPECGGGAHSADCRQFGRMMMTCACQPSVSREETESSVEAPDSPDLLDDHIDQKEDSD